MSTLRPGEAVLEHETHERKRRGPTYRVWISLARKDEGVRVALGLVTTKDIGERHHIEVEVRDCLEGGDLPLSIPEEPDLLAGEQSNSSGIVGGGEGNLALQCQVGHK